MRQRDDGIDAVGSDIKLVKLGTIAFFNEVITTINSIKPLNIIEHPDVVVLMYTLSNSIFEQTYPTIGYERKNSGRVVETTNGALNFFNINRGNIRLRSSLRDVSVFT